MRQQRKAVDRVVADGWLPPAKRQPSFSSGQPLDHTTRHWMESRFAHDFSRVRVHADPDAASAAESLGARAFTKDGHIAFGPGEYAPHTDTGRHLLAHELAHVAGAREQHADAAASDVMLGRAPVFTHAPAPHAIQMKKLPLEERTRELAEKMQIVFDSQEGLRPAMRKEHSAPGVERAKQRREGSITDLTGVGRIQSVDRVVAKIRELQTQWPSLTPSERAKWIGEAASAELELAGVPPYRKIEKGDLSPNFATLDSSEWTFSIDKKFVKGDELNDVDAAKLANAALHEARHAEQYFLSARYAAGPPKNQRAGTIMWSHTIPFAIARKAVEQKFDERTDAATAEMGEAMFTAHITNRAEKKRTIRKSNLYGKMVIWRTNEAKKALAELKASPTEKTFWRAERKYKLLLDTIEKSGERYQRYLDLPSESDASEVGEAATLAFRES